MNNSKVKGSRGLMLPDYLIDKYKIADRLRAELLPYVWLQGVYASYEFNLIYVYVQDFDDNISSIIPNKYMDIVVCVYDKNGFALRAN